MSDISPRKLPLYAIFQNDKWTGWSLTQSTAQSNNPGVRVIEVDPKVPVNLQTCIWVGTPDDGEVVDTFADATIKPTVTESELIHQKYDALFREYRIPYVLDLLLAHINVQLARGTLAANDVDPALLQVVERRERLHSQMLKKMTHFQQSPHHTFQTEQQVKDQFNATFATNER